MSTPDWSHADGLSDHVIDPHYNGNGLPFDWSCHTSVGKGIRCDRKLLLNGEKVPVTINDMLPRKPRPAKTAAAVVPADEPPLSSQP